MEIGGFEATFCYRETSRKPFGGRQCYFRKRGRRFR